MSSTTNAIQEVIDRAVEAAVRKVLNVHETTNRRLLTVEQAAVYLGRSKREIFNMIASNTISTVGQGKLRRFDVRDLDNWIAENKH